MHELFKYDITTANEFFLNNHLKPHRNLCLRGKKPAVFKVWADLVHTDPGKQGKSELPHASDAYNKWIPSKSLLQGIMHKQILCQKGN